MCSTHVQEMPVYGNAQLRDKGKTRNSVPESLAYGATKPGNNMEATFSAAMAQELQQNPLEMDWKYKLYSCLKKEKEKSRGEKQAGKRMRGKQCRGGQGVESVRQKNLVEK